MAEEIDFIGPDGERTSEELAVIVVTRMYNDDGVQAACITESAASWRERAKP